MPSPGTPASIISPAQIRPYPEAHGLRSNTGRKKQQSEILSSTPLKNAAEDEIQKKVKAKEEVEERKKVREEKRLTPEKEKLARGEQRRAKKEEIEVNLLNWNFYAE